MPSPLDPPAPAAAAAAAAPADSTALPGAPEVLKTSQSGGRKNPWLAHVKATMRGHRNKSFKQVLKLAKKTYKRAKSSRQSQSQSQSQDGGKKRKPNRGGSNQKQQQQQYQQQQQQQQQQGGSGVGGGKEGMAAFGANAEPVA
jgi:hypothetical protein